MPCSLPVHLHQQQHHYHHSQQASSSLTLNNDVGDIGDGWYLWNNFQQLVDYHTKIFIALELNDDLVWDGWASASAGNSDASVIIPSWLRRLGAEPVKMIILPTRLFVWNDAGYPVLPKELQEVIIFFLQRFVTITLSGPAQSGDVSTISSSTTSTSTTTRPLLPYIRYIRHLQHRAEQRLTEMDRYIRPYFDVLQVPLQPLGDNLEAQTYETFETDVVKYILYQRAIVKALNHWVSKKAREAPLLNDKDHDGLIMNQEESDAEMNEEVSSPAESVNQSSVKQSLRAVVLVVGAGRGPLVAATLQAVEEVNQSLPPHLQSQYSLSVSIYAIEKNPEAIITLRNRVLTEQWRNVEIISQDMRNYQFCEKADFVVSELLGSFGDNELSPECLRGLYAGYYQSFPRQPLISIPQQYASFLQPISSPLLYMCARDLSPNNGGMVGAGMGGLGGRLPCGLQTPYVVYLHRFCPLSDKAQLAWEFKHPHLFDPTEDEEEAAKRYAELRFTISTTGMCHGFAGYFSSLLYGDVSLSILPSTHTPGMASWFPIYLPILQPVFVREGEEIVLHIWRCLDGHKMWYEWSLSSPQHTTVHNLRGKHYHVIL
eukprot:scaffold1931_cov215-Ochromonas_danica.AAC.42